MLLWTGVLPQAILLLFNIRWYSLASGEVNADQKAAWVLHFSLNILLLAACAGLAVFAGLGKRRVSLVETLVLLALSAAVLTESLYQFLQFVPSSIAMWILLPEELCYYRFMFTMPVALYSMTRIFCADLKIPRAQQVAVTLGTLAGTPLVWYGLIRLVFSMSREESPLFIELYVISVPATIITLGAFTRVCVATSLWVGRRPPFVSTAALFLFCVCAPLGGLWLNARLAFPVDLQSWPVYAMAAINGVIVMLPASGGNPRLRRAVWLAQCALYPFSLYFFLLFMPWLPLSLVAIMAAGAGFLILAPTLLFIVHTRRIAEGYGAAAASGQRIAPALLGVGAFLLMPAYIASEAMMDKGVLGKAIDYVYSPNYGAADDHFTGSREATERSLARLRDYKAGLYIPIISDFYNWVVFGNLVLPDDKMNTIHRAFFGSDLAPAKPDRMDWSGGRPGRGRMLAESRANPTPPDSAVAIASLPAQTVRDGDCERTTVTLNIHNSGRAQSEFVTTIHVPDGVLISGFRLKIGQENVPGRIYEKKTAMWVYHMIRDVTSRDPGILVYSDANSVEMRVFPVAAGETRQAEVEFLYPAGLNPGIKIGDRPLQEGTQAAALILTGDGVDAVTASPAELAQFPVTPRVPYLHFIVDRSANSKLTDDQVLADIRAAAAQFPAAKECAITFANYESITQGAPLSPLGSISAASLSDEKLLPARGGFLAGRAMKRALLAYHARLSEPRENNPWRDKYPVFIIIRANTAEVPAFGDDLPAFQKLAPDMDRFYVNIGGSSFEGFDFNGKDDPGTFVIEASSNIAVPMPPPDLLARHPAHPVALLRLGSEVSACPVGGAEAHTVLFGTQSPRLPATKPEPAGNTLEVLDHGVFRAITPTAIMSPASPYARGMRAWRQYLEWVYNPSPGNEGLAGIVRMSNESGILTAATSFIVVENSAQWKELDAKQRQKLGRQDALEFQETPEPSTWVLIGVGVVFIFVARRRLGRKIS